MLRLTTLSIRSLLLLITFVVALPAAGIIAYSTLISDLPTSSR